MSSSSSLSNRGRDERAPRIYVGNLPNDIKQSELEDLFQRYGRIVSCDIKRTISGAPFAFVEFEDSRDAEDAIKGRDGYNLDGCRLRVEVPFSVKGNYRKRQGPPRRGQYRLLISGLPQSGSWQDVKDHLREAGECVYADVFRDGTGVVEYNDREDMEYAIRNFDGSKFRSHEGEVSRISVKIAGPVDRVPRSASPSYERNGRGGGGGGGGGGSGGGGGGGGYRREGGRGSSRDRERGNGSYRRRSRSRSRY